MDSSQEIDIDQDKNNLEDEYGYEDDDVNDQEDQGNQNERDDEVEAEGEEEEEEDDDNQDDGNDGEEDEDEDMQIEEVDQQKEEFELENQRRGRVRVNQGDGNISDNDEDDDDEEEDDDGGDNDNDDDDDDGDSNEDGQKRHSGIGSKQSISEKKRNEFWKYRHKNKDEKWGGGSPTNKNRSSEKVKFEPIEGTEPISQIEKPIPVQLVGQQQRATTFTMQQSSFNSKFEDDNWMQYILERAAKYNEDILQQKPRISEIVKLNEKNRSMQIRQVPIETYSSSLFPSNVPAIVVTEDGYKYLTNNNVSYQKGTLEEFIQKNVAQEHVDLQGEYSKYGYKKSLPFPKKKLIKKKPTKKNTFGADLIHEYE